MKEYTIDELREFFADYANAFLDYHNRGDDMPRPMDDFNYAYEGYEPWEVARAVFNGYHWNTEHKGDFNPNAEYYFYNGYANPVSLFACELENYWASIIDARQFAEYLAEQGVLEADDGEAENE